MSHQCCYVKESVEEIYALAAKGYSSSQLEKMKESGKKKVEEAEGMPFYN